MNKKENETLFEKLKQYEKMNIYPFHMPGHKRRLAPSEAASVYGMDITEIDGFDNLHEAEGILKEAQAYAARLYHSTESHFIVNGSTAGILAAIAGTCDDGNAILVARNCHKSVYHAIELHHLKPVYIYPHINTKYGINEGIYPQDVEKMWITSKKIQAIVITSPTYDGVVSDIKAICKIAHRHGIPVIVDEAHGAHFNFSGFFPESAVTCGADIVIQSLHKTLPAMTQTAIIHFNGNLIDRKRICRMLAVYQTSSPSYILMGSMDACLHMMEHEGPVLFEKYTKNLEKLRRNIHRCRHICMPEYAELNPAYSFDYDRSKIVLSVRHTSLSGRSLYERLLEQYGLQMEMMSSDYVLAMTSVGDSEDGYQRLEEALFEIDAEITDEKTDEKAILETLPVVEAILSIYDAGKAASESVPLALAEGYPSGEYVYLYPPGIPLVTPGEIISREVISVIEKWIKDGLNVTGISHGMIKVIKGQKEL